MLGLVVCCTVCAVAAVVGCIYPYVAFLTYVAFAIIKPSEMWFWSLGGVNLSAVVSVGLIIGWILQALGNWNLRSGWLPMLCLLAFWGWAWISWWHATETSLSPSLREFLPAGLSGQEERGLETILALGKIIFPCFIGATLLDTPRKVYGLFWMMVIAQGYICWEMNLAYVVDGYNRIHEEGLGGFDNNCMAVSLVATTVPAWLLALRSPRWWQKVLGVFLGLLHLHTVLLSFSRGGMMALAVSLCLAFLAIPGGWRKCVLLSLLIVFAVRFAGPEVRDRFLSIFEERDRLDASAKSRLELWRDCMDVISKCPFCGIGLENWPAIAPAYGWPEGKEAHTLWLQVGAECGLPGLAFLLGYYVSVGWRLYRHTYAGFQLQTVRDGVLAGLAGFMVAAQFVSIELLETPYYLALCGVGALRFVPKLPWLSENAHALT